ncbi:NAD-dependent epimerase/dehydratase family protein [Rathayibacter sp. CAU 1779]
MRVFVAGGTGVLGQRLVPQLVARGHDVTATTTAPGKTAVIESWGATAAVMDGLDAAAVSDAVAKARPDVIVHELTALAGAPDMKHMDRWFATTSRLRREGTDHLLAAAEASGVAHVVSQSYGSWNGIREGGWVKDEEAPLDPMVGTVAEPVMAAVRYVEDATRKVDGTVLRYGWLYGPGALDSVAEVARKRQFPVIGSGAGHASWVHCEDAASATLLAIEQNARGTFNIVDDEPAPAGDWLPHLAACAGGKPPLRVPVWLARPLAGDAAVVMMTEGRGFSNSKAKRVLGWEPRYRSWREGFREVLA